VPKADSASRTINRICDILNSFNQDEPVLTLTEISRRITLPKSTTYRFLEAMESQGMITREANGRGYKLGYQLIHWGMLSQSAIDLRAEALPIMRTLTDKTGETSILSIRVGNAGIWIEVYESRQPVRLTMRVGEMLKLHAGASSKVLWAFLPEAQIDSLLGEIELTPILPNTITDPDKMREELRVIRERGYATSFEETDRGAMGIAAPVFDHRHETIAGIGIAAPISRVPQERVDEIAKTILEASQDLSRRLGAAPKTYQ
jgi:DNA-binding IclR family transcriptional regulator